MNKAELKTFAIETRRDLLKKVALRAKLFGIDKGTTSLSMNEQYGQLAVNEKQYPLHMKHAFTSLERELNTKGYEQLIEEVAYTWFNRIIAIRYMEVHGYLPERVHVLSSSTGKAEPDILNQYDSMDLHVRREEVAEDIRKGDTEAAYRKLFIAQCNALNSILPFLFEKINDYTELLLPDFLLDSESVISKLVGNEDLTESFNEVEVIGWLYQFYNTEPKDKVFANLKKNKKIEKYDIPAATQLFTPKWIVQYMVENSLGQIWLESYPDSTLKESMRYYIEPAEQEEEVQKQIEEIRYKNVNLEEITIIDPCVGSGHILVYAFDLLYQMYEEAGYPSSDIPQLILEKNLYGLDIDDRAAQLASFALMMKAREKSRRIFRKNVELNVMAIQESNGLDVDGIVALLAENEEEEKELRTLFETFVDAKNYGSILQPEKINYTKYVERVENKDESQLSLENYHAYEQLSVVNRLLIQADILTKEFDVAVTNPPYMGLKGMNNSLQEKLKKDYSIAKSDLFTVILSRMESLISYNGFIAAVTMQSWMFLSKFEEYRKEILRKYSIISMIHLDNMVMGIAFGTSSFIIRKHLQNFKGNFQFINLENIKNDRPVTFPVKNERYSTVNLSNFAKVPGSPIVYWLDEETLKLFRNKQIFDYSISEGQNVTGNNDRFVRFLWEVNTEKVGKGKRWLHYAKGGSYRKWYGNIISLIDWSQDAREHYRKDKICRIIPEYLWYKPGITWGLITSSKSSFRILPKEATFDKGGSSIFMKDDNDIYYFIGLLNSKVSEYLLEIFNSTVNLQVKDVRNIPVLIREEEKEKVKSIVLDNLEISKKDWDAFEISWDFNRHPLIMFESKSYFISESFQLWKQYTKKHHLQLQKNEEEINNVLIQLYGLESKMTSEVQDKDITINQADRVRDTKSFLSYFIGCMMGRYSLDVEGLAYAGGEWDESKYQTFKPNKHGLLLLTDDRYFDDDIITRLREFLSVAFSPETVDENIGWIAESLTMKKNESAEERLRRYFIDEFFKDHVKVYQKRPIYWLVDSGKQKGLRTLVYLHRYQPDTMATIRFEHLQEIQAKYNNEISSIDSRIVNPSLSATEKRELDKKKTLFQNRLDELVEFDKDLAMYANEQIDIDLDDGVNVNYAIFDKVLTKM